MQEQRRTQVSAYFTKKLVQCKEAEQNLFADDRADEAVFAKVRGNVYAIFDAIFSAAVQNAGEDDEKLLQFFIAKTDQIPMSWHTSQQKAMDYNDEQKACIEKMKLETAAEIKAAFEKIWEGAL